ncbi:MAG: hypothetical protein H7Z72_20245 [Bacteroidetes bacterium]|nr:hypothetical protein [Fibrella sp.]
MKKLILIPVLALPMLVWQCGVSRQLSEAKALGNCQYNLVSADSISLSGYDIRDFKSLEEINPVKYPRIATGLLTRNVPLNARINLDITNPTNKNAAINQLEYRVLLAGQELATGFLNQRIAVSSGGGKIRVPIRINTNAYKLVTDPKTRDAFTEFVQNLSGNASAKPSKLTIKIKPTLGVGDKAINYPGYITIDKEVTNKILLGQ